MISTASALLALCFVFNLFHTSVLAGSSADVTTYNGSCKKILERTEWRDLSDSDKKHYIDAVKCLQSQPAHNTSRPASWTRFDEFQAYHIEVAVDVHFVGQFISWHRLFVKWYETALREECGYEGAQPYWDWSKDADLPNTISKSPVWDSVTGFGGDGVAGTYVVPDDPTNTSRILPWAYHGCVQDGPFADYTVKLGPGLLVTDHCLTRGVNDSISVQLNSTVISEVLTSTTFETFRVALEGAVSPILILGPHFAGHVAVGGDMTNFFSSPGDPLFYLHHTNLDRIWWHWQEADPGRLYEVSGPTSINEPYGNLTLSFILTMGNLGASLPVQDVMDIRTWPSCYTYSTFNNLLH